jgi:hypothetical protein
VSDDGALQPARQRLADAVAALIDPQRVALPAGRTTWLDSVYQQLTDAVSGQTGTARTGGAGRLPIWADCFDLLHAINTDVHKWRCTPPTATNTVARLTAMTEKLWRPQDAPQLQQWAGRIESWVYRAGQLLDPATVVFLPDPCPVCGAAISYRRDSAGDNVRQPALSIRYEGARCGECERLWEPPQLPLLGRMLGYHPQPGIIG